MLGLAALAASAPLLAQEPRAGESEAAERARRILEDESFQRELPTDARARERAARRARSGPTEPRAPRRGPDLRFPLEGGGGALAKLIALIALGGIAAFVLFRLATALVDARSRRRMDVAPAARPSRAESGPPTGSTARELLDAGRTAEALHVLLVELLRELAPHAPASRTSRELVRELALDDERRAALVALTRTVERGLFAAQQLTPSEVEAGLELAATLRGGAATR